MLGVWLSVLRVSESLHAIAVGLKFMGKHKVDALSLTGTQTEILRLEFS